MRSLAVIFTCLVFFSSSAACDSDATSPPSSGTSTLGPDEGIDFSTGRVRNPGTFANADLLASINGDSGMRLATGGTGPTDNRAVTWFKNPGGVTMTFPDLASVPSTPTPTSFELMPNAKVGFGCLLVAKNGDLVRAWVEAASRNSVTVQWARVVAN